MKSLAYLRRAWGVSVLGCLAGLAQLPGPETVGRIVDYRGLVSVRPVDGERWTPVTEELLLAPGDWVRTDGRGPNAAQVRLATGGSVILGPGTLVEFPDATTLRLTRGELEAAGGKSHPLTVGLPGQKAGETVSPVACAANTVLRLREGAIEKLDREPMWLQGFKGTVVKESMGELLVTVDGRDVPLTVGYHKVTIDIRDQIARTVVEESFVNHTSSRLEGVFHFPLPADASISDFGMWIGDELVQADVVEKQRAREIYETILREQRDPGLLEWAGGNIFKARVFPIFPQSEKRVTITYTQVLPMRNGAYRYTYPLVSEMLRQKPLRELQLVVNLYSAAPLTSVRCVSHEARIRQAANAATVEFSAQEVTPSRDFELVIEPDLAKQPLTVVPHQRGNDGYFLLLLNPPSERVGRRLLGGDAPLRLIVLVDTSGSIDAAQRAAQADFLRALFGSLGRRDRFTLAACDVECTWLTDGFRPSEDADVDQAMAALAGRRSLGWTDLDRAFAAAAATAAKADGPCQTVYLGDGIVATAETDPVAFAKRLAGLFRDAVAKGASCHAVATGSSYEAVVLKTLAGQGAGSVRRSDGEGGPVKAARELLDELTRPPVRHLALEFTGLRAARVYPAELPNLPAGAQQIVVGRYQPSSLAQDASVRVSGRAGQKEVAFEQPLRLPPGEEGNTFIPRLWARHHLDDLLAQGAAPAIRAEIVAFSQEYRIMTPYTSFLVLESDADRERFGVQRQVAMRDGEAFFAAGREKGSFQLVQQQMQRAAAWRAGLRRQVLAVMAQLGREPGQVPGLGGGSMFGVGLAGGAGSGDERDNDRIRSGAGTWYRAKAERRAAPTASPAAPWGSSANAQLVDVLDWSGMDMPFGAAGSAGNRLAESDRESAADGLEEGDAVSMRAGKQLADAGPALQADLFLLGDADRDALRGLPDSPEEPLYERLRTPASVARLSLPSRPSSSAFAMPASALPLAEARWRWSEGPAYGSTAGAARVALKRSPMYAGGRYDVRQTDPDQWLRPWVPELPSGQSARQAEPRRPEGWSVDAFRLACSLDRRPALASSKATVRFLSTTRSFAPRRGKDPTSVSTLLVVAGPERWMALAAKDHGIPTVTWSTPEQVGAISLPYRLGRVAKPGTAAAPVLALVLDDFAAALLPDLYRGYRCRLEARARDRIELILDAPDRPDDSVHVAADPERRVLLEQWTISRGKVTSRTEFERFRAVAGSWWATRITVRGTDGGLAAQTDIGIDLPDPAAVAGAWARVDRAKADAVLVPAPLPEVVAAKRAAAAGKATVEQRLALVSHAAATQQWEQARPHIESLQRDLAGKVGRRYLEIGFLTASRRHEELRQALLAATGDLVAQGLALEPYLQVIPADRIPERCGEYGVVQALVNQAQPLQANERLEWLDLAKPVYDRQPARLEAGVTWQQQRATFLRQANQSDAALAIEAELARTRPWDTGALTRYAQNMANTGEAERATMLLESALKTPDKAWQPYQLTEVRNALLNTFENAGWHDRQIAVWAAFLAAKDSELDPYQCQRYLAALLRAERETEADTTATAWMEPLLAGAELTPAVLARATAAAQYMVGDVRAYSSSQWLDEKWLGTLETAVRRALADPKTLGIAQTVMGNYRFARTDSCRALRAESAKLLAGDLTTADIGVVQSQVNWVAANDPAVEADTWRTIAGNLEQRWVAELVALRAAGDGSPRSTAAQVNQWGGLVARVCQAHVGLAEWLGFCRRQHQAAADSVPLEGDGPQGRTPPRAAEGQRPAPLDAYRDAYANQWFAACLAQPWRQEYEDEAFGVLPKLAADSEPPERVLTQAGALQALVDWMVAGRQAAVVAAHAGTPPAAGQAPAIPVEALLPGQAERLNGLPAKPLQQLSRTERKQLDTIALELSRAGAAARLAVEWERQPEALKPWNVVERLGLLARLAAPAADAAQGRQDAMDLRPPEEGARGLAAEALELLGPQPPATFVSAAAEALFLRRLALAEFLVARTQRVGPASPPATPVPAARPQALRAGERDAPKKPPSELGPTATALLTYMRAGVAMADEAQGGFWRARLYRLLLALDRPTDMESELRGWVKAEDAFSPWRVPLAYLLAETDRLRDAVAMLEAVEADDELGPGEYRSLAGWYAALGDEAKQRAAKLKELAAMDEGSLRQWLDRERQVLAERGGGDRDGVPANLDPATIDVLTALLRKAEYPANHTWLVRELHARTRDFRLLRCLAEGVIGHTAQQVYPLLQSCRDLLREVQSEATLDELAAAVKDVRTRARTPVDRRALLLLEAEAKRRASEVVNQPGQHVPAARAALQAAFRETWSSGEPRLMAEYLAALGRITQGELAQEQLSQIETLYQRVGESAVDRLEIAHAYGRMLGSYERYDAGIEALLGALEEYRQRRGGRLNDTANAASNSLIGLCEQRRHFAQGETWLRAELERPANNAQREWLVERLCQLYEEAIRRDGETALGRGQGQYAAVDREIVTELGKPGRPQHLHNLVSRYCAVALVAKSRTLKGYAADLWTFAAEVVPDVLRREAREPGTYQTTVSQVAQALHELATPRDGLAFLITCAEAEPAWFRFDYSSFWQQHGGRLAQWRTEAKVLGDLEPRLLTIVLRELRTDLDRQQQRSRALYHRQQSHFWEEKAGEFAKVAEEVHAQRRDSGAAVAYVADYLFYGLGLYERAIAILQDAWQRDLLDENGQFRLADFLHQRDRYKESVPVLAKLVAQRPDNPEYRRRSVIACAKSGQAEQAERARADAERHFKEHGLWGENAIAALASGCLHGSLYNWAVTYYDEAIALHRRTVRPAAQGDPTLSQYYASLAAAHAGLGDTAAAVEAAAGAVISWGRDLGNRRGATGALVQVLRDARDLDGYVAALDRRISETRLDSPIVRKALGQVYAARQAHEKAVAEFRRALAGQPNDADTHRALVASCDALRWPDEAVKALLELGALLPRDLEIRQNIYKRLVAMAKPQEAERAATAIVEAMPNEAESHQAMAALRQEQDRWPEAVPLWRRVCELRELEPTGLLGLATAQIHLRETADAQVTLDRLLAKAWPERFGDVHGQARNLIRQLEQ